MISLPTDITCGYCDCSEFGDLPISPPRTVQKFEIEFYLSDAKSTFCNEQEFPVRSNHIQLSVPGQIRHSILPFTAFFFKFRATGDIAARMMQAPTYFEAVHSDKIKSLFRTLLLLNENDLMYYSTVFALLNQIFEDSQIPSLQGFTNYETVSAAKTYIEKNYANAIDLSEIAASVNLSRIYFRSLFCAVVGCSPHDYLINCRILNAKKLLWDSTNDMSDIAVACGFGCQQYMNKVFKQQTGMTPGQYRKSVQEHYFH